MVEEIVRKRNKASQADAIRVWQKLQEVMVDEAGEKVTDRVDDGFVKYVEGSSDHSVATDLGVAESTVKRIRMEMFGNLENTFGRGGGGAAARIDALEERVRVLEEKMGIET